MNSKTYLQIDGVAMGSPPDPILTNNSMVELEQNIIPALFNDISLWKRYIDDTISFVKSSCINHVLKSLNGFPSNIKFTIQIEKENKIAFLDILLIYNYDLINTTVYRKKTNTDLYINWKSFSPYLFLFKELNQIEAVFKHQNNYPSCVINKVIKQVQQAQQVQCNTTNGKKNTTRKYIN